MTDDRTANFEGRVLATCGSCRATVVRDADAQYCPRCGTYLPSHRQPADPLVIRTPTHQLIVNEAIADGTQARLYACAVHPPTSAVGTRSRGQSAVFKIAATPAANDGLRNESATLHLLTFSNGFETYQPFVPRILESFVYVDETRESRRVNLLAYDPAIRSPHELYSLVEVRAAYPVGLDPRDAAWIFRRLLGVLSAAHDRGVAHNAVTPAHVLIEPKDHKLVLVGWSHGGGADARPHPATTDGLARAWTTVPEQIPSTGRAADLALASRTMVYLLGGNWRTMQVPDHVEPSLARFLERCAEGREVSGLAQATNLLGDFDRLIELAWGKRTFRPFEMPARADVT